MTNVLNLELKQNLAGECLSSVCQRASGETVSEDYGLQMLATIISNSNSMAACDENSTNYLNLLNALLGQMSQFSLMVLLER